MKHKILLVAEIEAESASEAEAFFREILPALKPAYCANRGALTPLAEPDLYTAARNLNRYGLWSEWTKFATNFYGPTVHKIAVETGASHAVTDKDGNELKPDWTAPGFHDYEVDETTDLDNIVRDCRDECSRIEDHDDTEFVVNEPPAITFNIVGV